MLLIILSSATLTLRPRAAVLQDAAVGAGGDELCHVAVVEAGLGAEGEAAAAQQLGLPLCIRAAGRTCSEQTTQPFIHKQDILVLL